MNSAAIHVATVRAMAATVVIWLVCVPFIVTPNDYDVFTSVKEITFRLEAVLALLLLTIAVVSAGTARLREMMQDRPAVILLAAAVLWAIVTAALSTHRPWSVEAVITVIASSFIFVMAWYAAPSVRPAALTAVVVVAALESVLVALQEHGIWQPFVFRNKGHITSTATIGNPNVVGSYLAIAGIVLGAASVEARRWLKWILRAGAAIAFLGTAVSGTRTAILAIVVTMFALTLRQSAKHAAITAAVMLLVFATAFAARVQPVVRLVETAQQIREGRWDAALSARVSMSMTALEMFLDRPLVGLGPGTYKYHYMRYRSELPERYPAFSINPARENAAEVHNDHLQYLAETGVIGYGIFVTALVYIGWGRARLGDDRSRIAAEIGMPLAVVVAVIALAQFPLQVAPTRHLIVTLAGLVLGWRR